MLDSFFNLTIHSCYIFPKSSVFSFYVPCILHLSFPNLLDGFALSLFGTAAGRNLETVGSSINNQRPALKCAEVRVCVCVRERGSGGGGGVRLGYRINHRTHRTHKTHRTYRTYRTYRARRTHI